MTSDNRRGFHKLIESGRGLKRVIDFITNDERERQAREAAAPTPIDPSERATPYCPTEAPPPPPPPPARCPLDPPAGWRCVREGPHLPEACELRRRC